MRVLAHRKWRVLGIWLLGSVATILIALRLPDVYTSETLILVDPQKVPEAYVKSTVTGDVRNRLGTLSQQILSQTRLQKIIEQLNLYPEDKKKGMAREDVIAKMRSDISVRVVSDFGATQDLQAFRISYSGPEPRLVAQVTNQLASQFINENLTARSVQAEGTTEFITNQKRESLKALDEQEAKLRDFKLKHVGEMPQQQTADLQLLGQAQSQYQLESEALARAEQQRDYLQSLMAQTAPVVDLDQGEQKGPASSGEKGRLALKPSVVAKARLAEMLSRYGEQHPDIRRLKSQIEEAEAREAKEAPVAAPAQVTAPVSSVKPAAVPAPPSKHYNPILQSQLRAIDDEIAKHKAEQQRLSKLVSSYRSMLDAIPIREQEVAQLERDYEISKAHYAQLLEKELSAKSATQLEMRQKGEKFEVLDSAQPAERPARPNRVLIDVGGSIGSLVLGLLLATAKEFYALSIIVPRDIAAVAGNLAVLGVIPIIRTQSDRRSRRRRVLLATSAVLVLTVCSAVAVLHYRGLI